MTESLRSALKQLRLSGLLESLDVRLHEAAGNGLNHAEFLELLSSRRNAARNRSSRPSSAASVCCTGRSST